MKYSSHQNVVNESIIDQTKKHVSVQATAGSGKTTTLLRALKDIPLNKKAVFLSFSNAIVDVLKEKVPKHIKASTLHSLGCRFILKAKKVKIDDNKYFQEALETFPIKERRNKKTFKSCLNIKEICSFARLTLTPFKEENLSQMCDDFNIDCNDLLIIKAIRLLKKNTNLKSLTIIDFTDMVYLPSVNKELVDETFDYVFLDEAQDTNKSQLQLIENLLSKDGRLISVGDERQCIFGFSGNDIDSFSRIRSKEGTTKLPLTVTYRCAKEIVKLAKTIYPNDIQEWEEAIEGEVRTGDISEAIPGDMVICRNTKPLIKVFFDLLDKGIKSYVVGKELEKGLVDLAENLIEKCSTKDEVVKAMEAKLEKLFLELQLKDVSEPSNHPKFITLLEKCDIIKLVLNKISGIGVLVSKLHEIFREDKKSVKLLTIHRSKGLECDRVFFIERYNDVLLCPSKWAKKEWELIQERNLLFVAYTRAKKSFIFVNYKEF